MASPCRAGSLRTVQGQHRGDGANAGGQEKGQPVVGIGRVASREQAAEGRAEDETKPKGSAHEAHATGAFLGFRDVGHIGHGDRDICAHDAAEAAREEHHPE